MSVGEGQRGRERIPSRAPGSELWDCDLHRNQELVAQLAEPLRCPRQACFLSLSSVINFCVLLCNNLTSLNFDVLIFKMKIMNPTS